MPDNVGHIRRMPFRIGIVGSASVFTTPNRDSSWPPAVLTATSDTRRDSNSFADRTGVTPGFGIVDDGNLWCLFWAVRASHVWYISCCE